MRNKAGLRIVISILAGVCGLWTSASRAIAQSPGHCTVRFAAPGVQHIVYDLHPVQVDYMYLAEARLEIEASNGGVTVLASGAMGFPPGTNRLVTAPEVTYTFNFVEVDIRGPTEHRTVVLETENAGGVAGTLIYDEVVTDTVGDMVRYPAPITIPASRRFDWRNHSETMGDIESRFIVEGTLVLAQCDFSDGGPMFVTGAGMSS